ncbi:Na/Pi cotransporter family protein, partial [Pseudomonas aeruginosa]|uniref:Na/Pi cotransporter family protein n=1 Tax=Pseudomonas aeruginosa TaxID=287 RepID=UPI001E30FE48
MLGTILLINLAGAVALLLWGTHMVSSGVLRGFGTVLRNWLGRHLGNRWLALLAGLGITGLLQSSTATSLMAASFTASGTLGLAPALAVMLGANVGTTLVVQLLSFDTSLLAPLALLSGLLLFRLGDGPRLESLGQCLIGLGLMLLALALLGHSLQQIEASPAFVAVIHGLEGDPLIALLLAALLTWACHSSVAVVLLVASLAQAGLVSLPIALALVLGANLGGALPALGVAGSRVARRLPLGNLLVRLLGCLLVLPWLTALAQAANALGGAAAVWFHSAFNLALALLAIGFTGPLAALLARLLPEEAQSDEPGMPRYLDEAGLEVANIGLANATREVLRLADMASLMLRATSGLLQRPEAKVAAEIRRQDQALDQLSAAIRAYLADLGQDGLGDSDADRAQEILLFAINIEHIGDLVANSLLPLAMRWAGRSRAGSEFELGPDRVKTQQTMTINFRGF